MYACTVFDFCLYDAMMHGRLLLMIDLMINGWRCLCFGAGPTGVGKTEIARRLAKLANAPFVKVISSSQLPSAFKFLEV